MQWDLNSGDMVQVSAWSGRESSKGPAVEPAAV